MKSILTNCLFLLLVLTSSIAVSAQQEHLSFAAASTPVLSTGNESAFTHFSYSFERNRIFLNWTIAKNQDTNQFEIEKSTDGKRFTMAALLFGSETAGADDYEFYEKATTKKTYYRIKIIQKDGTASYSPVIIARKK